MALMIRKASASDSYLRILGMQFLNDPLYELNQLKRYPAVAIPFIKFNTKGPSSAPVARLFSWAGQILLPRRNNIQDDIFEIMLLLTKNVLFMELYAVRNMYISYAVHNILILYTGKEM